MKFDAFQRANKLADVNGGTCPFSQYRGLSACAFCCGKPIKTSVGKLPHMTWCGHWIVKVTTALYMSVRLSYSRRRTF